MHEQSQEYDDRKWNSNQPEQRASTKAHVGLLALMSVIQQCGIGEVPSACRRRALIARMQVPDDEMRELPFLVYKSMDAGTADSLLVACPQSGQM
jgi:hypothetical protein